MNDQSRHRAGSRATATDAAPPPAVPAEATAPAIERPAARPVSTGLQMKRRNPFAAWLGLPLITLGFYAFVWYYLIHSELADFDRRRVISPSSALMAYVFGWVTLGVWTMVSFYTAGKKIANAQRAAGLAPTCSGGLGLLLFFVFGLGVLYYQSELNKVVRANETTPPGHEVPLYA
ncbi:DUF4234 domain-containing protein [Planobispora siamensis]|uniref:DUF4234 domain-containing protein n=1 Tax=Planobispora siamensis TaxID=936338 RepID=A0A8J3WL37_9ACTN|nr:DUF4234 domain-containing protein [Planobispora siamensis]GIH93408.1 hypothetical protein Psi01_40380 [Planobispora siamensis]